MVAVVIRTYERPMLLARAIASVQNQTFQGWTLIIVNNGGKPGPVDDVVTVAMTATPCGEIQVLHLPERVEMEEASNRGLAATDSDFFAIHDDDDSWNARFLEVALENMRIHPKAAAVVTGANRIFEFFRDGKIRPIRVENFQLTQERLSYEGMIGNNSFPSIAALFRRRVLKDVGDFDSTLPVLGDWEFNLRAVHSGGFVYVPECLANYHIRTPDSEVLSANSITMGIGLYQEVRKQLHSRWLAEPMVNGVNKGALSIASYVEERPARNTGVLNKIVSAARNPKQSARTVARRAWRMISR